MAIDDSSLRQSVFSTLKSALTAASITASDADSSSITPTYTGMFSDKTKNLPEIVINRASPESTGKMAFNDGFDHEKIVNVALDIYAKKNVHVDQLSDGISNYFTNNSISGFPLVGWEEDDELSEPNDNKLHRKTIFLAFKRW